MQNIDVLRGKYEIVLNGKSYGQSPDLWTVLDFCGLSRSMPVLVEDKFYAIVGRDSGEAEGVTRLLYTGIELPDTVGLDAADKIRCKRYQDNVCKMTRDALANVEAGATNDEAVDKLSPGISKVGKRVRAIEAAAEAYAEVAEKWQARDYGNVFVIEPRLNLSRLLSEEAPEATTIYRYYSAEERNAKLRLMIIEAVVDAALKA